MSLDLGFPACLDEVITVGTSTEVGDKTGRRPGLDFRVPACQFWDGEKETTAISLAAAHMTAAVAVLLRLIEAYCPGM